MYMKCVLLPEVCYCTHVANDKHTVIYIFLLIYYLAQSPNGIDKNILISYII